MIQVADRSGTPIKGLFKKSDGSLVVHDPAGLLKSKQQKNAFDTLNNEISELKQQMKLILDKINGIH